MSGFDKEMQRSLEADAEKLSAMTGEQHAVAFIDDDDATTCEFCIKTSAIESMSSIGGGGYICAECETNWRAVFDACAHEWKPDVHDGWDGMRCEKCCGFVRNEDLHLFNKSQQGDDGAANDH